MASVIREVQDETRLIVSNLQSSGYIQWYNPIKQSQYFVFLFKNSTFFGELKDSIEGKVKWMSWQYQTLPHSHSSTVKRKGDIITVKTVFKENRYKQVCSCGIVRISFYLKTTCKKDIMDHITAQGNT